MLRVRDHHKGLHARLEDTFALERVQDFVGYAHDYADTVGKNPRAHRNPPLLDNGRPRPDPMWTPTRAWCDLASLVWVECERHCGDRVTTNVHAFISSLPPKARLPLQAMRRHGSIENAHHWVLDVAFGEDDSRIRTGYATHNMVILKVGIANKRLVAGWNKDYLCQLIGLGSQPI